MSQHMPSVSNSQHIQIGSFQTHSVQGRGAPVFLIHFHQLLVWLKVHKKLGSEKGWLRVSRAS